jgi:peptidyl-tRNA hydrolase
VKKGDKIYLVSRADISISQQAVQCCHALRQFVHDFPSIDIEWFNDSNYLTLLIADNERGLIDLLNTAELNGLCASLFREEDMNGEITAIAIEPGDESARLCKKLKML